MQAVLNLTEMFLTEHISDFEILSGLAVAVVSYESKTFAIEVQMKVAHNLGLCVGQGI